MVYSFKECKEERQKMEKQKSEVGVCLFNSKNHEKYTKLDSSVGDMDEWYKFKDENNEYFDYQNLAEWLFVDIEKIVNCDYSYIQFINDKYEVNLKPSILNDEEAKNTIIREFHLEGQEIVYYPDYSLIKPMRSLVHVKKER